MRRASCTDRATAGAARRLIGDVSSDFFDGTLGGASIAQIKVAFDHLRFTQGGENLGDCGRTPTDCNLRDNFAEFGGVLSMPDAGT